MRSGSDHAIAGYVDVDAFDASLVAFCAGRFVVAQNAFALFEGRNLHDAVARLYLVRLQSLGDVANAA